MLPFLIVPSSVVSSQLFSMAVYFPYSSFGNGQNFTDTSTKPQMVAWTVSSHIYYLAKLQATKKTYSLAKEIGSLAIRDSFQDPSAKVHCEFYINYHPKCVVLLMVLSQYINPSILQLSIM